MTVYKKIGNIDLNENVVISADEGMTSLPDPLSVKNIIVGNGVQYGQRTRTSGSDNIVYTDDSMADGYMTEAGTRSFGIVSGDMSEMSWTLKSIDGLQPGMTYSVRLLNNYDMIGDITSVDVGACKIYVDGMPWMIRRDENLSDAYLSDMPFYAPGGNALRGHPTDTENEYGTGGSYPPSYCFRDFDFDGNTLWIVGRPDLGDMSAYSTGSHSEGAYTVAQKQWSHAEGLYSQATGKYSHAEGMNCRTGYAAHAEGISCTAARIGSHAEGYQTSCLGYYSHSSGCRAVVGSNHKWAFCWQGNTKGVYVSHGEGTFNVNPKGGLNGFYIGENALADVLAGEAKALISSVVDKAVEDVLRVVMNPTDEEGLDKVWKGAVFEMDDGKKRVFYGDLSGLTRDGTWYAFPFWHRPPEVDTNPKAHLVGVKKLDPRISSIGTVPAVDTPPGETISQSGFNACRKLAFADFQDVVRLNAWSFSGCAALSSLNVPNVQQIGRRCFSNCQRLSSVSLPSARKFEDEVFVGCHAGFKLDFGGKTDGVVPTITENTLSATPDGFHVVVPADMLDEWRNAPAWSDYASIITAAE